jgi:hypothetical protein
MEAEETGLSTSQRLRSAAISGEPYDLSVHGDDDLAGGASWGPERQVDAAAIYGLCVGTAKDRSLHARGVHIVGALILGELDFEAATLRVPLILERCFLEQAIHLNRSSLHHLSLTGSYVPRVTAEDLVSTASLDFGRLRCPGGISLRGATVGGFLSLAHAALGDHARLAEGTAVLEATGLHVTRDVDLRSLTALGGVSLDRAKLAGKVDCTEARFDSSAPGDGPRNCALSAVGCVIGGDADLTGVTAVGKVVLANASIAGGLICARTSLALSSDEMVRQLGKDGLRKLRLLLLGQSNGVMPFLRSRSSGG